MMSYKAKVRERIEKRSQRLWEKEKKNEDEPTCRYEEEALQPRWCG